MASSIVPPLDNEGLLEGSIRSQGIDNSNPRINDGSQRISIPHIQRWMFRLSDVDLVAFLMKVADASVPGLLALNIFSATYFLAWGKPGTICLDNSGDSLKAWIKVFIVLAPIAFYPITLCTSGMAQLTERDQHRLGIAACLVVIQIAWVIILGGAMTVCMLGASIPAVIAVTVLLLAVFVLTWGRMFNHPKWTRYVYSKCCCGAGLPAAQPALVNQMMPFPLSGVALVAFMMKLADASVMGLLTLNIFSATYFLAWGKAHSTCLLGSRAWLKDAIVLVPFAVYPITLFTSGMVKLTEQGQNGLGCAAGFVLIEIAWTIILGGVMTFCTLKAPLVAVLVVTVVMLVVVVFAWGRMFSHPECLRNCTKFCCWGSDPELGHGDNHGDGADQ